MSSLRLLLALLVSATSATAQEFTFSLIAPEPPAAAGAPLHMELVVLNRSADAAVFTPPPILRATASSQGNEQSITLQAVAPHPTTIPAGSFSIERYTVSLPRSLHGTVVLNLGNELPAAIRTAVTVDSERANVPETPLVSALTTTPDPMPIQRSFAGRFGAHDSVYFIYGADDPVAKLQFSLKYRVLSFDGEATHRRTLQFGYTQRSLWDLNALSSPFYDTSYMPELFYEALRPMTETKSTGFSWLGYQTGFLHESNGRDGEASRSLNIGYLRPVFMLGAGNDWHLIVAPELFAYLGGTNEMPRIKDYRGYGRLRMAFGRTNGPGLVFIGMIGKHFKNPTIQLDFTLPLRTRILDFETFALVQYFNGYGESILAYTQKTSTVRAGFALVR